MAVRITSKGAALTPSTPKALFSLSSRAEYESSPDGQRFLVHVVTESASPITVLLNLEASVKPQPMNPWT